MGAFLLGILLLLNAAAVLPALHALWHDDGDCRVADCAVATVAGGGLDGLLPPVAIPVPAEPTLELCAPPVRLAASFEDCPVIPGRAPPA